MAIKEKQSGRGDWVSGWVAVLCVCVCVCVCACVRACVQAQFCTHLCVCVWLPWTVARQASLSVEFFRQECCSELPFPPPENLPDPGIGPTSAALQADSSLPSHRGSPQWLCCLRFISEHVALIESFQFAPFVIPVSLSFYCRLSPDSIPTPKFFQSSESQAVWMTPTGR